MCLQCNSELPVSFYETELTLTIDGPQGSSISRKRLTLAGINTCEMVVTKQTSQTLRAKQRAHFKELTKI